jgi:hypothetical protein
MNHQLGAVGCTVLVGAVLLLAARVTGYRLFNHLDGLIAIMLLVGVFLLGAAFLPHHH